MLRLKATPGSLMAGESLQKAFSELITNCDNFCLLRILIILDLFYRQDKQPHLQVEVSEISNLSTESKIKD